MAKAKILIVDDEQDVCETIQDRLRALNYDAHYVLNGPDALEWVKKNPPDLIILDILMPNMDGYEVSQKLMDGNPVSAIPIIMLTALHSQQNKLKALTMGIDDYITKPFDFEELVARMEAVLRRGRRPFGSASNKSPASSVKNTLSSEDSKRLNLLKEMSQKQIRKLEPIYNIQSSTGYSYPFAAHLLGTPPGAEWAQLELLTEWGCFDKEFFDKILLCPFCKNYNLNIRENCPSCKSVDLKIVDMIHHYRCAYTGIEEEFKQGIEYVCPKCHRELKNIGVDYDKPGQNFLCEACHSLSADAETRGQCRACNQIFSIETAIRQIIFSYLFTPTASEAIAQGAFSKKTDQESWINKERDVYNLSYFRSVLTQEVRQAQHFKRPLSLILLTIENLKAIYAQKGEVVTSQVMKQITEIFKENLRNIDLPAYFQENSLVAMLLECDKVLASEIAQKIRSKLEAFSSSKFNSLKFSLRAVSFEKDGKSEDVLLKKLLEVQPL